MSYKLDELMLCDLTPGTKILFDEFEKISKARKPIVITSIKSQGRSWGEIDPMDAHIAISMDSAREGSTDFSAEAVYEIIKKRREAKAEILAAGGPTDPAKEVLQSKYIFDLNRLYGKSLGKSFILHANPMKLYPSELKYAKPHFESFQKRLIHRIKNKAPSIPIFEKIERDENWENPWALKLNELDPKKPWAVVMRIEWPDLNEYTMGKIITTRLTTIL